MSAGNRASKITKAYKVVKKHYKPVASVDRPVLEHMLFACCLENAPYEAADEAFATLQESYFDWNEVRVTTIRELSDVLNKLPDARPAATRLKRSLQAVFETHYSFDIDFLKKQNLGKAQKEIRHYPGVTPFVANYVTQHGLAGHAIPVNRGVLDVFVVLDVVSEKEAKAGRVPGMERAIAKTKGHEFASLIHQLGVDYLASPFSPRVRNIILEIDADAKARLPKRGAKKADEASAAKAKAKARAAAKTAATMSTDTAPKKKAAKTSATKKPTTAKSSDKGISKRKPR